MNKDILFAMMKRFENILVRLFVVFVLAGTFCARADLRSEGLKSASRMLVVVVGPDWNPASPKVRTTFASSSFRQNFPKTLFGEYVHNEATKPDAATQKGNAWVKSLVPAIYRYPTILIYDAKGRSQGRVENIPADLNGAELARRVKAQIASVEAIVAKLPTAPGESLAALQPLVPGLTFVDRRKKRQVNWYGDAWQNLLKLDPEDKQGWQLRLFMGNGIGEISRGTALVGSTNTQAVAEFEKHAENLLKLNLSPEQKQAILLGQFARIRKDKTTAARQVEILKRAHTLAPRSIWGWAAFNYLAERKVKVPKTWDILSRVEYGKGVLDYQLKSWKKVDPKPSDGSLVLTNDLRTVRTALKHPQKLDEAEKLAVIRASVLTAIGPAAFRSVLEREGGREFARRFFRNREWLEDFFASGPVNDPGNCYIALAELVHNDINDWTREPMGRRVATAMAIRYGKNNHLAMVQTYRAYAVLARAGRLHRSAYALGTHDWRLVNFRSAADILFLNQFVNVSRDAYAGIFRWVPYRKTSCFGEPFYNKGRYYGAWRGCDIPSMEVRRQVGGVCVELSDFGAACAGAHGIPSGTCGQPGHRAWIWRTSTGYWAISNYIKPPTWSNAALFGGGFTGLTAMEKIFADPAAHLNAEYQLWLYHLARREKAGAEVEERLLKNALRAQEAFVPAWQAYGKWLIEAKVPRARIHAFLKAIATDLHDARWLLWNEIDRQLEVLAKTEGVGAVREEIRDLLPLVRESEVRVREDIDYGQVFDRLVKRYAPATDAEWLDLLDRWLSTQWETRQSFRAGLARATTWAGKDAKRLGQFVKTIEKLYAKKAPGKPAVLDWRGMVASTLKEGDLAGFREAVRLHDSFVPPKAPEVYPANDFGGEILSHNGMLTLSSSHGKYDAPENYARFIDRAGLNGVKPARLHTNAEKVPWATVTLPGDAEVTGVFIDNDNGKESASQVPLVVWTSMDGKTWTQVWRTDKTEKTYRVPLTVAHAKYVRVGREASDRVEPLRLRKILVYGKRHW